MVEIDSTWSIEDVLDANEALDVWDDAQDRSLVPPESVEGKIRFIVKRGGSK